jgi:hypothetical protein
VCSALKLLLSIACNVKNGLRKEEPGTLTRFLMIVSKNLMFFLVEKIVPKRLGRITLGKSDIAWKI